jgi:polysaccharide biosynthesis protein PslG
LIAGWPPPTIATMKWSLRPLLALFALLLLAACARREATPLPTAPPASTAAASGATSAPPPAATATPAGSSAYLPYAVAGEARATAAAVTVTPAATATPTGTPEASPTPAYPLYEGPPLPRERLGIQVHLHREDQDALFAHLESLPLGWVKVQVSWKLYEPADGEFDAYRFGELDQFVSRAGAQGIQVLLGVAKAPEWSRPTTEMDGPPADYALFTRFMRQLAQRYQGQVAAYELWNEPNLQREWEGEPLSAARTVALIRAGAAGVVAADPAAHVISAAPATTGVDDGVVAIDDRRFLREMLAAGLGEVVDGVGVHPYGWANPPNASAAGAAPVAPSHNNHPSFFYADTLRDYRDLLAQFGYHDLPLWATEFGWASYDQMGTTAPAGVEYMDAVNEWDQAVYTLQAYALAQELPAVGPLFLWNLNFAPTFGNAFTESAYSILRPDGSRRPLFLALQALPVE